MLENLSRELNRIPSAQECIARLREHAEFAESEAGGLQAFVDKWAPVRVQQEIKHHAQQKQTRQQQEGKLRARVKALFRKPRGHFRQMLTEHTRRSAGIDNLVSRVRRMPEFSQFTSQEFNKLVRKELISFQHKEEQRAFRIDQTNKARGILESLSQELNRTPSVDECIGRLRECSEFASIGAGQLQVIIERGLRARRRQWKKKTERFIEDLSQVMSGVPSVDECIARMRGSSQFAHIEASQLEQLVVQATRTRAKRKARQKARAKRHQEAKGGDAMKRAILSGFETSRRRH